MPIYTDKRDFRRMRWASRLRAGVVAAVVLSLGAPACVVRASGEEAIVYGHPAVHVVTAPTDIYLYPRLEYRDSYAYLVGDVWYYETPRGWVAFQRAPRELEERRVYAVRGRGRRPPPRVYEPRRVHEPRRVYEPRRDPVRSRPEAPRERGRTYRPQ